MMGIDHVPDWETRLARHDAFFAREIIDRPVVSITLPRPNPDYPYPDRRHATLRDRWMDAEHAAEGALSQVMNTEYLGDALPKAFPNLGPEVFSAFFGCELEFGEDTSWSKPILSDWSQAESLQLDRDNIYWKKIIEITDALLAVGEGRFYTGITDLHPGADAIAAFRDPVQLNYDMVEAVDQVKSLLRRVTEAYLAVYDFYHDKLRAADQPICTWAGPVSTKTWLVPSNDFSCMISPAAFRDVFLQSIVDECRHYEASLYHLDGPNALRHLDTLLEIEELSAIQWVYGAGNGRATDWIPVYRRCQRAGKGIEVSLGPDELDTFMENLRPEGVWLSVGGVHTREEADAIVRKVSAWTR